MESLVVALQWRCTVNVLYSTDPFRKQVCSSVCSGSQTSLLEVRFTWYRPVCYGWTFIWVVELQWPFDQGLLSYIVSLLQNCFTGNYQIGGRTHWEWLKMAFCLFKKDKKMSDIIFCACTHTCLNVCEMEAYKWSCVWCTGMGSFHTVTFTNIHEALVISVVLFIIE